MSKIYNRIDKNSLKINKQVLSENIISDSDTEAAGSSQVTLENSPTVANVDIGNSRKSSASLSHLGESLETKVGDVVDRGLMSTYFEGGSLELRDFVGNAPKYQLDKYTQVFEALMMNFVDPETGSRTFISPYVFGSAGDFLLSNGRILSKNYYQELFADLVVGIVVDRTFAIALDRLKGTGAEYYFSSERVLIANMNTSTEGEVQQPPVSSENPLLAVNDYRKNNAAIAAQLAKGTGTYPAYSYCAAYAANGYPAGRWFLPTMKQLYELYQNLEVVNSSLSKLDKDPISNSEDSWYWSCIQSAAEYEWLVYFGSNYSTHKFFNKSSGFKSGVDTLYCTQPIIPLSQL